MIASMSRFHSHPHLALCCAALSSSSRFSQPYVERPCSINRMRPSGLHARAASCVKQPPESYGDAASRSVYSQSAGYVKRAAAECMLPTGPGPQQQHDDAQQNALHTSHTGTPSLLTRGRTLPWQPLVPDRATMVGSGTPGHLQRRDGVGMGAQPEGVHHRVEAARRQQPVALEPLCAGVRIRCLLDGWPQCCAPSICVAVCLCVPWQDCDALCPSSPAAAAAAGDSVAIRGLLIRGVLACAQRRRIADDVSHRRVRPLPCDRLCLQGPRAVQHLTMWRISLSRQPKRRHARAHAQSTSAWGSMCGCYLLLGVKQHEAAGVRDREWTKSIPAPVWHISPCASRDLQDIALRSLQLQGLNHCRSQHSDWTAEEGRVGQGEGADAGWWWCLFHTWAWRITKRRSSFRPMSVSSRPTLPSYVSAISSQTACDAHVCSGWAGPHSSTAAVVPAQYVAAPASSQPDLMRINVNAWLHLSR